MRLKLIYFYYTQVNAHVRVLYHSEVLNYDCQIRFTQNSYKSNIKLLMFLPGFNQCSIGKYKIKQIIV